MGGQVFFQCNEERFREMLKETLLEVVNELQLDRDNHTTLLNIQEAAALLNLAVATIYEKTSQRSIPHYKHGKKVLFKKSELLAWVELRKVRSTDEIQMPLSKRVK
jgi:excisionase family DNA binding protein